LAQRFVCWNRAFGRSDVPENVGVDSCYRSKGTFLHSVLVVLVSKKIINTELGLDDLLLEVGWEERSDLIGEGVSVVYLDVTDEVPLC